MTVSNKCNVCKHEDIDEINAKLIAGVSPRTMAGNYGLHYMSLYRHKENHLPQQLVKAKALQEENAADDLLDRVETIYSRAWELMQKAETDGKYQPAVSALKEARACLELTGRLIGELKTGTQINIHYNPQWLQLKTTIYDALKPYPEARQALVERLEDVTDAEFE